MLTILIGKSAAGKDKLQEELVKDNFIQLILTTSRPMRDGEIEGKEYYFTTSDEFKKKIEEGYFIEYRDYQTSVAGKDETWYYGLGKQVNKSLVNDYEYITILDPYGAKECIDYYGKDKCFIVSIELDDKTREERASLRGGFDKIEWDRRLKDDAIRFSEDVLKNIVDVRILNNGTVQDLKNDFVTIFMKANPSYTIEDLDAYNNRENNNDIELD